MHVSVTRVTARDHQNVGELLCNLSLAFKELSKATPRNAHIVDQLATTSGVGQLFICRGDRAACGNQGFGVAWVVRVHHVCCAVILRHLLEQFQVFLSARHGARTVRLRDQHGARAAWQPEVLVRVDCFDGAAVHVLE